MNESKSLIESDLISNYKVIMKIDITETQLKDAVDKTLYIIERYNTLKQNNFKDFSLETVWQNVKLNPQLLVDDPSLKTYLLNMVDMYDTFYKWNKLGKYSLYEEVNNYFITKQGQKLGSGKYDQEIQIQQEALDRAEPYNYYTRKRMIDELKYMRENN